MFADKIPTELVLRGALFCVGGTERGKDVPRTKQWQPRVVRTPLGRESCHIYWQHCHREISVNNCTWRPQKASGQHCRSQCESFSYSRTFNVGSFILSHYLLWTELQSVPVFRRFIRATLSQSIERPSAGLSAVLNVQLEWFACFCIIRRRLSHLSLADSQ